MSPSNFTPKRLARLSILVATVIFFAVGIVSFWPWIGNQLTENGQGEPMFLLEGISIWPAIVLRIASAFLALFLIRYALRSLKKNQIETFTEMHLPNEFHPMGRPRIRRRTSVLRNISLGSLRRLPSVQADPYPSYPIFRFIVQLHYRTLPHLRLLRALAATVAMMCAGVLIGLNFGLPDEPARGALAKYLYKIVTFVDVFLSFLLIFLVVDATLLSRLFIYELRRVCSNWPKKTIEYYGSQYQVSWSALSDWIDMEFIAKRTKCITALIYLPFIVMACLVLSRNDIFTNFSISITLVIIWVVVGIIVIGSAISLRSAAEAARRVAIKNLNKRLVAAKGRQNTGPAAQLEALMAGIENLRDGAFAPWSSQPVVRAFLLPLLAYGASLLVRGYALPGF